MAIAPLFQRFVDDELALAPALVARVLAGTVQLLGPSKDSGRGAGERIHYAEIVAALQRRRGALREDIRRVAAPRRSSRELDEHREHRRRASRAAPAASS